MKKAIIKWLFKDTNFGLAIVSNTMTACTFTIDTGIVILNNFDLQDDVEIVIRKKKTT